MKLAPTMRQTHRVGERLFVDFSGDGLTLASPQTGECSTAKLFVAVPTENHPDDGESSQ